MMNTSISRRQFLKASGLAAAGACAAGLLTGCGGSSSGSASGAASSGSGSSYTILYDSQSNSCSVLWNLGISRYTKVSLSKNTS